MAVKKVLLFGDPELRRKSKRVQDLQAKEVEAVMRDLKDTLKSLKQKHKRGGGLSAVQIGKRVQIIYIEVTRHSFFMINPKIIKKSRRKIEVWDFCRAVATGAQPEMDGKAGLRAKALCEACYESATAGRPVKYADVLRGTINAYQKPIDAFWGI